MQVIPYLASMKIELLQIARLLPKWFTPGGLVSLDKDLQGDQGFVCRRDHQYLGFVLFKVTAAEAEISWMAVHPDCHRQGIGRLLINSLVKDLAYRQVQSLIVKTLGDSVDYEPYAQSRNFYRSCGFADFQKVFQPKNPAMEEELTMKLLIRAD